MNIEDADNVVDFPRRNVLVGRKLPTLRGLVPPPAILPGYVVDGFNVIYGMPKRGKSFWAIELSVCFAGGAEFHGAKLGCSGRVLYVAAEGGAAQVTKRVDQLIQRREFDDITVMSIEENWHLVDHRINLIDRNSIAAFLDANPGPFALIVLDTLARNMDGDENSTQDMNDLIAGCDALRMATGATIILIHHCGKDGKLRGSSALYGALDTLIQVYRRKEDGLTYVRTEDARDFELPASPLAYRLADGVLEGVTVAGVAEKLDKRESDMRAILVKLCADAPRGVPLDQWKAACENSGLLAGKLDTRKHQFARARERLFEAQAVKWGTAGAGSTVLPHDPNPADDFTDDFTD